MPDIKVSIIRRAVIQILTEIGNLRIRLSSLIWSCMPQRKVWTNLCFLFQVELSVLAPSGNDAVAEDMKSFAEQLRPLVMLDKIIARK